MNLEPSEVGPFEKTILTLDQMRALASPAVAEVFDCFSAIDARSIPDVSKEIHRSQATVGVHVDTLLDLGLVRVVGTRKKRSRTERLFSRTAHSVESSFRGATWDYYEASIEGFNAAMRRNMRGHARFKERLAADATESDFAHYNFRTVRLTREGAQRLRDEIIRLGEIASALEAEAATTLADDVERVHVTLMFYPTVASSLTKLKKKSRQNR